MIKINPITLIAIAISFVALIFISILAYWIFSPQSVRTLTLVSGGQGGTYYAFSKALSEIINTHSTKIKIRVLESSGSIDNANKIATGKADLGLFQSDTVVEKNVNIAARLFPEVFHLVARTDSNIKSIADLKGKKIALPPKTSGSYALFKTLRDHYEIETGDITVHHGSLKNGMKLLEDKKVDALFVVMAMGNKKLKNIIKNLDVELVSINQAKAISLFFPALRAGTIPVGAYSGEKPIPAKPIQIISVDSLLGASKDLPPEYIKELTSILFEKRQELILKIPQGAFISQPNKQHQLSFEVHKGADQFFRKNEPPFFVRYAEQIGLGITVLLLIFSSIWQLRTWLSDSRKNRADDYNKDLVSLTQAVNDASSLEEVETIRKKIFNIFSQIMDDLDNDRIEENSIQSFSFALEVALSTLNQRELIINTK